MAGPIHSGATSLGEGEAQPPAQHVGRGGALLGVKDRLAG
jgi:hypothetical protein